MPRVATITTDELTTFFSGKRGDKGTDRWESSVDEITGDFHARSNAYTILASPKGVVYSVNIKAGDDPSDSDSKITDDPIEFIVEFLETGSEGDGFFRARASMTPDALSGVLRSLARGIVEGDVGPRRLSSSIRRAIAAADLAAAERLILASQREDSVERELGKLQDDVRSKGWTSKVGRGDDGIPVLQVDVGGQYLARIVVDHVVWDYSFQVTGQKGTESSGITDDPIAEFRAWRRDPSVQEARDEALQAAKPPGMGDAPAGAKSIRPKDESGTVRARPAHP